MEGWGRDYLAFIHEFRFRLRGKFQLQSHKQQGVFARRLSISGQAKFLTVGNRQMNIDHLY